MKFKMRNILKSKAAAAKDLQNDEIVFLSCFVAAILIVSAGALTLLMPSLAEYQKTIRAVCAVGALSILIFFGWYITSKINKQII